MHNNQIKRKGLKLFELETLLKHSNANSSSEMGAVSNLKIKKHDLRVLVNK